MGGYGLRLNICSVGHFIHVSVYGYVSLTIKEDSLITSCGRSGLSSISESTPVHLRLLSRLQINVLKRI